MFDAVGWWSSFAFAALLLLRLVDRGLRGLAQLGDLEMKPELHPFTRRSVLGAAIAGLAIPRLALAQTAMNPATDQEATDMRIRIDVRGSGLHGDPLRQPVGP